MTRVILEPRAVREYRKLPRDIARRIRSALVKLEAEPSSSLLDIKKLQSPMHGYRLRVGEYRVLFSIDKVLVRVYAIRHRKDAYR